LWLFKHSIWRAAKPNPASKARQDNHTVSYGRNGTAKIEIIDYIRSFISSRYMLLLPVTSWGGGQICVC